MKIDFSQIGAELIPKCWLHPISIFLYFKNINLFSSVLDFTSLFQVRKWTMLIMAV